MKIKSLKDVKNLSGKKVLLRVDFNVPIKFGKIRDDYKIEKSLPTIYFLLKQNAKIIIITHLGRPDPGEAESKFSARPLAEKLSELSGRKVKFVNDCAGFKAGTAIAKAKNRDILMLENVRLETGEQKNSKVLAKKLARLGNIYVNDAFSFSHRATASMSAIKNYLPSYAGLLLEKEVLNLNKILHPKKPLIIILGGAKIKTKMPLIKNLRKKAHRILIGGCLANNFLAAHGFEVGRSLVDKESIALAKKLKNSDIILPVDVLVGKKKNKWRPVVKSVNQVGGKDYIFDIGPQTIKLYVKFIKKANTIIWNGPMGMFEEDGFQHGTLCIARFIASYSSGRAFGVVGGGETVEALRMTKMLKYVDWVSTGGGAMLAFLAGEKMPGLQGLIQ